MARRRINTKFLGTSFIILLVCGVGLVVFKKFFFHENPRQYIAMGGQYAKEGQWDKAVTNLSEAVRLSPRDSTLLVKLGDAQIHLASIDGDYIAQAGQSWRHAVEVDPDNKDAWKNLLMIYDQELHQREAMPKNDRNRSDLARVFGLVRETATQVVRLYPDDPHTKYLLPALNIRLWLLDIPIPETVADRALTYDKRQTDDQKVDAAAAELLRLESTDPENAEIPMWLGRMKLHRAEAAARTGQPADAYPYFADAAAVFDDSIKAKPKNLVSFYWAKCQILARLEVYDTRPANRADYMRQFHESLDAAQALVDPKAPEYMSVKLAWARNLAITDPARAEQVYQDLIKRFPQEYAPRISLATMLKSDASRRNDALTVLQQVPDAPPITLTGPRRQMVESMIADAQFIRLDIQTDQYIAATPGQEKEKLAAAIQSSMDSLTPAYGKDARFLKQRGKFELAQRHIRDAIQSFESALALSNVPGSSGIDTDLAQLAADAYRMGGQNGKAIELLEQIMRDPSIYMRQRPHMALAQLYLNDRNLDKAREQVKWLSDRFPNAPEVVMMQIQLLNPTTDQNEILADYAKLPEETPEQMAAKAQVAHETHNDADTIRLLKLILIAKPKDVSTAVSLAQMYAATGQKDEAKQTVRDALKVNPNDANLTMLGQSLSGASADTMHAVAVKEIDKTTPDPFYREMRLAALGASEGHADDELDHLKKAEAIQPNDSTVLDHLFMNYLNAGKFDEANRYLPKLIKLDADQAHGLLLQLKLALAKREAQSAIALGRQLTTEFPEFSNSWEGLGEALQLAGQPENAASQYVIALQKQASNVKALRNLISVSYQMGKFDDAKRYIAEGRQKFPNDPAYEELYVDYELRFGDPDSVLPSLLDAVKTGPDVQRNYANAVNALLRASSVQITKGNADSAKHDVDQARDVLNQAVARWPDSFDFSAKLAQVCASAGDLPAGEAAIKAIAARPQWKDSAAPPAALAQMYMSANKPAMAEAPLREAVSKAKDKNAVDLQVQLAQVLTAQGKFDDALKVLEANQDKTSILKERLEVLLAAGRGPDAEAEIARVIKANPTNPRLIDLEIFVNFNEQKFDEVTKLANQAITTDAKSLAPYYYRGLASLYGSHPDVNSAIRDLTHVRDASPREVDSHIALADAYSLNHDTEDGIRELETALAISPENKGIRLKLLQFYETSKPPRWFDAEQIISDALVMPQFKNDPDFLRGSANMWAARGDYEKATNSIRAAMAQTPDKSPLIHDYLNILLAGKNYSLVLQESNALVANPATCPWWVYDFRARAEARNGDTSAATTDFTLALDKAGAERGHGPASTVAFDISGDLTPAKAIELIAPRVGNSLKWKMVAIPVYDRAGDRPTALKTAESAMESFASLDVKEQDELLALTGSLYLTADPPMPDKAIPIYKQLLDRHPDDNTALNNLACLFAEMTNPPQPAKGLEYSQKAYDDIKSTGHIDPLIYDTQGWVLILAGKVDDGISILHQVVDAADFPDAHYHLAEGYLRKQRPEDAQREIAAAQALIVKNTPSDGTVDGPTRVLQTKMDSALKRADQMIREKAAATLNP